MGLLAIPLRMETHSSAGFLTRKQGSALCRTSVRPGRPEVEAEEPRPPLERLLQAPLGCGRRTHGCPGPECQGGPHQGPREVTAGDHVVHPGACPGVAGMSRSQQIRKRTAAWAVLPWHRLRGAKQGTSLCSCPSVPPAPAEHHLRGLLPCPWEPKATTCFLRAPCPRVRWAPTRERPVLGPARGFPDSGPVAARASPAPSACCCRPSPAHKQRNVSAFKASWGSPREVGARCSLAPSPELPWHLAGSTCRAAPPHLSTCLVPIMVSTATVSSPPQPPPPGDRRQGVQGLLWGRMKQALWVSLPGNKLSQTQQRRTNTGSRPWMLRVWEPVPRQHKGLSPPWGVTDLCWEASATWG